MLSRTRMAGLAVVVAAVAIPTLLLGDASSSASVVQTDHTWHCRGPVELDSVSVTITPNAQASEADAVHLDAGCTGTIGSLTVNQQVGDGVKVADGARDIRVASGTISCSARADAAHQDGIQALGGNNVVFSVTIDCPSANNSDFYVNGQALPTGIVCDGCHLGGSSSSTVFVAANSRASGVRNSVICPSRFFTYRKAAVDAVDEANMYPASC